MPDVTITGLPNATLPLDGTERVPMDQDGGTKDATTGDIANLALVASPAGAREWSAATITQAEAEAGTETTRRAFTAQRVRQAITGWWTGVSTEAGRAIVGAASAAAQRTLLDLGIEQSPVFTGLTITGTDPVVIPHIHGSIAGNFYIHVRNTSGGTLPAGTAVYVTGSVGDTDRLQVAACDPTDPLKMPAVAVLEAPLANNGDGDAIILGELRPTNTSGLTLGAPLYVGAGGALTATVPTTGIVQSVATVARVNVATGTLVIHIGDKLGIAALRSVGTVAGTVAAGDDGRFTDARSPTAHTGTHAIGGADALTPADIGADVAGAAEAAQSAAIEASAPAAQGVTNGNAHDHNGGDGGQIAYSSLSGTPTLGGAAALNVGTTAGTVAAGDDSRFSAVVTTSAAGLQAATSYAAIAYASTVTLDMAALNDQVRVVNVTGPLTLAMSNLAVGQRLTLRLVIDGTDRTLTVPGWRRYGYNNTTLKAGKAYRFAFEVFGTINANEVDLAIAEQL